MTLMQRRRSMMQTATSPAPTGPLYPVADFSNYTPSSAKWAVARPHITATTSANSRSLYFGRPSHSTAHKTTWAKMFTLQDGDVRKIEVKNISFVSSSSASNYFYVSFYSTSGIGVASTGTISFGSGSGTVSDFSLEATQSGDADINAVRITVYRAVESLDFDLYLFVNGIWYTI